MTERSQRVQLFPAGPFRESAQAWLEAPTSFQAAQPRLASTVLLLRDAPLEVFMIERSAGMAFAPSTWVFPGGSVDRADERFVTSRAGEAAAQRLAERVGATVEMAHSWLLAAVREVFEEAGVLLASRQLVSDSAEAEAIRAALEEHRVDFSEVLSGRAPAFDDLLVVDRWVTPEFERRRYDTLFFLALLPAGVSAEAVSREAQRGQWVEPQLMLEAADRGEVQLLPPTRTRLLSLSCRRDAAAAFSDAMHGGPIRATRPEAVLEGGEVMLRAEVNP